jgi:hypothetical protein
MDAAVFTGSDYRIRVILFFCGSSAIFHLGGKALQKEAGVDLLSLEHNSPPLQFLRWTTIQLRTWLLLLNLQGGRPLTHFPSW